MELLAVKLEKKQNGSTEVYAGKKILGRGERTGAGAFGDGARRGGGRVERRTESEAGRRR